MQHEITNGRDPICNLKIAMVETLYASSSYHWWGPYMQPKVTRGRDSI